jgi:uncharacterized protein
MTILDADDPLSVSCTDAIRSGNVEQLAALLASHPNLATVRIGDTRQSRALLHIATDWPGHFPNVGAVIEKLIAAGADVNTPFIGAHRETPLHWAASSDDTEALDALLDAGADIEATGSVLGGGTALADAVGFGQWRAARRLVERGATTRLFDAAALGLMDRVQVHFRGDEPSREELDGALWNACHGDQQPVAEYLLGRGADVNWIGWGNQTPLDVAVQSEAGTLSEWLRHKGAKTAVELT